MHLVFWGGPSLWDEVLPWPANSSSCQQGAGSPPAHFSKPFSHSKLSLLLWVDPESIKSAPFAVFLMALMDLSQT